MKKIMFNRPVKRQPWGGGGHMIVALYDYFISRGYEVVFNLESDIDVILMFDPRPHYPDTDAQSLFSYRDKNKKCKVVQRINDTDIARPNDKPWRDKLFAEANRHVDHTIFISNWVKDYFKNVGLKISDKNHDVIINGCNDKWYYPAENKQIDKKKIKLITHHWSDNPMKGLDVYRFIDNLIETRDDLEFTYLGRYSKGYIPKNTTVISPAYGVGIGEVLRNHDIYVTGARYEACGSHHIEAALCGLPVIYHKSGGAVPEVCKDHGISFSNPVSLVKGIETAIKDYDILRSKIDYNFLSIDRCCRDYENSLLRLFKDNP